MKKMQRIFAILMVMVMAIALIPPVSAEATVTGIVKLTDDENTNGKVTLKDAVVGQIYHIYQLAVVDSYDAENNLYSYTVTSKWLAALSASDSGFSVDGGKISGSSLATGPVIAGKARELVAYAKGDGNITEDGSYTPETAESTFYLPHGYYLIDTTVGTLCMLNTVASSVEISEKNKAPKITKKVYDDNTSDWLSYNDAPIGSTVTFRTSVTVADGSENYVVGDILEDTFDASSVKIVKVYHDTTGGQGEQLGESLWTAGEDYTVIYPSVSTDDDKLLKDLQSFFGTQEVTTENFAAYKEYDFMIKFSDEKIQRGENGQSFHIQYTARLNETANIGSEKGNYNQTCLFYGEYPYVQTDFVQTKTYTWEIDIFKHDEAKKGLEGVKFEVYTMVTSSASPAEQAAPAANEARDIYMVLVSAGDATNPAVYKVVQDKTATDGQYTKEIITPASGKVTIQGFDSDKIRLRETYTLPGYNKLAEDALLDITRVEPQAGAVAPTINVAHADSNGVFNIQNGSSPILPSTGATGTIIFVTVGGILVVLMGMLLVVKKRMTKVTYINN